LKSTFLLFSTQIEAANRKGEERRNREEIYTRLDSEVNQVATKWQGYYNEYLTKKNRHLQQEQEVKLAEEEHEREGFDSKLDEIMMEIENNEDQRLGSIELGTDFGKTLFDSPSSKLTPCKDMSVEEIVEKQRLLIKLLKKNFVKPLKRRLEDVQDVKERREIICHTLTGKIAENDNSITWSKAFYSLEPGVYTHNLQQACQQMGVSEASEIWESGHPLRFRLPLFFTHYVRDSLLNSQRRFQRNKNVFFDLLRFCRSKIE